MNVRQYCEEYDYAQSSVREWLTKGLIAGANNGEIPEGAKPKYMAKTIERERTVEDDIYDYLRALNTRRFIDNSSLHCSEADFRNLEDLMVEMGLITKSEIPYDGRWNTGFRLTARGLSLAPSKKKAIADWYQATVAGVTEGTMRALMK